MQCACAILPSVSWPALNIFPHCLINGTNLEKKKKVTENQMCVLIFSTTLSEIFLILRRNKRDMIKNVYWSTCKVPVHSCHILIKLEISWQIFEKSSDIKFHENPSSGSPAVPCGRTEEWIEGPTDRHDEANRRFSQFWERAKNKFVLWLVGTVVFVYIYFLSPVRWMV
jgi:hypothetical protein